MQAPSNPQTLNRYTYCNNNPVNLVDSNGHSWWSNLWKSITKIFESVVKAIVEAVVYTVLSPIITPIGAGFLVGFIAGGLGNGGGWSWSGAAMGGVLGAVGGAAFGTNGVNGFLGSAGPSVGYGVMAAGLGYSAATGGVQGALNFGGSILGGMIGVGIGNQINLKIADAMIPQTGTVSVTNNVRAALNSANHSGLTWNDIMQTVSNTGEEPTDDEFAPVGNVDPETGAAQPSIYRNTQIASAIGEAPGTVNDICENISAVTSLPINQLQVASTGVYTGNYTELYSTAPSNASFSRFTGYQYNSPTPSYSDGVIQKSRWPN